MCMSSYIVSYNRYNVTLLPLPVIWDKISITFCMRVSKNAVAIVGGAALDVEGGGVISGCEAGELSELV